MRPRRRLTDWLIIALVGVGLIVVGRPTQVAAGINIGVSPTSFIVNTDPGKKYDNVLLVTNKDTGPVTIRSLIRAFKASSDQNIEGGADFSDTFPLPDPAVYKLTASPSSFSLDPNETREVTFTIATTSTTPPGGYYVGLVFQTVPDLSKPLSAKVGQAIETEITVPILTRLAGNANESAQIVSFTTDKPTYDHGPVKLFVDIKNTGSVHFTPIGRIDITSPDGTRLDSLELKGKNILPGDTRRTEVDWTKRSLPLGKKTATAIVFYANDKLTKQTNFEVLPGSFASSAGTTLGWLVGAVVLFWFLSRRRKKKRRRR